MTESGIGRCSTFEVVRHRCHVRDSRWLRLKRLSRTRDRAGRFAHMARAGHIHFDALDFELIQARPGLFYRNLHRERLVRPARKGLVNLDFVSFGFCFEGVAVPAIDEAFDIERNVTL
jgi:hypothetical protein